MGGYTKGNQFNEVALLLMCNTGSLQTYRDYRGSQKHHEKSLEINSY